jgi:hypothetical protein
MPIYYAHGVNLYGTEQEDRDMRMLSDLGLCPENPNQLIHQEGYKEKGMLYFVEEILPKMYACAFRGYPDGSIPAGVAKEVSFFLDKDLPVFELPHFALRRILTVGETRLYLRECGQR